MPMVDLLRCSRCTAVVDASLRVPEAKRGAALHYLHAHMCTMCTSCHLPDPSCSDETYGAGTEHD